MTRGSATGASVARLASGAQLWRLNELGILGQALNAGERVSADRAANCWAKPRSVAYGTRGRGGTCQYERLRAGRIAAR
jgi:hypothetical protein